VAAAYLAERRRLAGLPPEIPAGRKGPLPRAVVLAVAEALKQEAESKEET
jgi:hypothetical protein